MENQKQSPLTVPVAIVIAGMLIAGAVFFAQGGGRGTSSAAASESGISGPEGIRALFSSKDPTPIAAVPVQAPNQELMVRPLDQDTDHVLGNPNADVVIVEYSDLECPFCKVFHTTLQRVIADYGKAGTVAWVYRHFPLEQLHTKAVREAEAAECAAELGGNSGFWKFTDRLFAVTPSNDGLDPSQLPEIAEYAGLNRSAFEVCLSSGKHRATIQASYSEAINVGGNGTPFNVFLLTEPVSGGRKQALLAFYERYRDSRTGLLPIGFSTDDMRMSISGAMPYEVMKTTVDALLK